MAYEELKAQIREYIKPNEQEEITGAIMQAILLEMVNQLGADGSYLPLTGGNVTGGIVVSSDLSSSSHEALRLNQSGISVEKIASVGLNEILNVTANSITYSSYFPSETPNTLTISLGYTGVTLSGGVTAASFINSSVDASIRYQYLLKADGNVISISDIGGTDMQTVWEALAASTNEQINVSHLSTALNGYIHPTLSNLSNGDILVYDSVGTWVNTSMSSFLSGYATETWVTTQLASYATQSWVSNNYLNKVSTNSGDIYINDGGSAWVLANLNTLIVGYGYITASALNGYATEAWVSQQGYLTSSALNGYIHPTITNLADGNILVYDAQSGNWVNTSWPLTGYATQSWVQQQGYITSSGSCAYASSAGNISISANNGDILINDGGSSWVATNLNSAISGFGYVTSSALAGYLPLSGGTMTGRTYFDFYGAKFNFPQWYLGDNQNSDYYLYSGSAIDFNLYTNGVQRMTVKSNGNVGIGTTSPSYKLDVNGSANATTLYENGSRVITTANIGSQSVNYATSAGSANILGHTVSENTAHSLSNGDTLVYDAGVAWVNVPSGLSDIRQKSVISYEAEPMFEAVANAPAIRFTWKDATYSFRRGIHVGSIAQYWQTTIPEAVTMDNEGMLSMQYDVIALLSTISVAKKVSEHERRIILLERENEQLKKEIQTLKSA